MDFWQKQGKLLWSLTKNVTTSNNNKSNNGMEIITKQHHFTLKHEIDTCFVGQHSDHLSKTDLYDMKFVSPFVTDLVSLLDPKKNEKKCNINCNC